MKESPPSRSLPHEFEQLVVVVVMIKNKDESADLWVRCVCPECTAKIEKIKKITVCSEQLRKWNEIVFTIWMEKERKQMNTHTHKLRYCRTTTCYTIPSISYISVKGRCAQSLNCFLVRMRSQCELFRLRQEDLD